MAKAPSVIDGAFLLPRCPGAMVLPSRLARDRADGEPAIVIGAKPTKARVVRAARTRTGADHRRMIGADGAQVGWWLSALRGARARRVDALSNNHAAPQPRMPVESAATDNRRRCYDNRCRRRYDNRRPWGDYDRASIGAASSVRIAVKAGTTATFGTGAVETDE